MNEIVTMAKRTIMQCFLGVSVILVLLSEAEGKKINPQTVEKERGLCSQWPWSISLPDFFGYTGDLQPYILYFHEIYRNSYGLR